MSVRRHNRWSADLVVSGEPTGGDMMRVDSAGLATARGTIVAVEPKSLQTARTPRELAYEMKRLVDGPKAAVVRIQQRVAVLRKHVPEIETALGRRVFPVAQWYLSW